MYAEKLCEFKVELKLEKLCDADGGVVCTHGEVRWVGRVGRWLSAREKWFHFFFRDASKSMLRSFVLLATVSLSVETPIDCPSFKPQVERMVKKCNIAHLTDGTNVWANQTTCGGYTLFEGNYYRCFGAQGPVSFLCDAFSVVFPNPPCTPPTPSTAD